MDELIVRAITAFYRHRVPGESRQPDGTSVCVTHLGKGYVVLRAMAEPEPLAVYRCMNRGELKRLKRWPAELLMPAVMPSAEKAPDVQAAPVLLDLVPVPRKGQAESHPDQAGLF